MLSTRRGKFATSSLVLLLLVGASGCGSPDVWVYVDNGDRDPMTVTVDGKKEATIRPGQFALLKFPPGKKKFHVESGGSVLFTGTKDLQESDKWGTARKYLFNPDNRHRYVTYVVKYGHSRLEGLVNWAVENSQSDPGGVTRVAYAKLSREVTLHPVTPWIDVSAAQYVLTAPPDSVRTKRSSATRTALTRVERADYDELESALGKKNPTERDLEKLVEAVETIEDKAP
jgi:hypothetical protein